MKCMRNMQNFPPNAKSILFSILEHIYAEPFATIKMLMALSLSENRRLSNVNKHNGWI